MLTLPGDAYRDKPFMEWLMAKKDVKTETTLDDFTDLVREKFQKRVATGGLNMIAAYHVKSTGLASFNAS